MKLFFSGFLKASALIIIFLLRFDGITAQNSSLNRTHDPVILTASTIRPLIGFPPGKVVGFRYNNGSWTQIPVQVDEKALLDIVLPYGDLTQLIGILPSYSNPKVFLYCDSATYTGPDPSPMIDFDDELVFMAKDAGLQSDGSIPTGTSDSLCIEVRISDPLGGTGFVYLFLNDGTLQQNAGFSYISSVSNLPSTIGFPTNLHITNLENTELVSSGYSWHFNSEWVSDEMRIQCGNQENILDRHKCFLSDTSCYRNEETFSEAENAFVVSRTGPVRCIRSYMGANSGPLTQRTHIFYENLQEICTDLRVHNISGFYDTFDWNSAAEGMTYRNELNPSGVVIDGIPDSIVPGDIQWEQVSGEEGTVTIVHRRITNMIGGEAIYSSFYEDNLFPSVSVCTGDGQSWGECGIHIDFAAGICTDPLNSGCAGSPNLRTLRVIRSVYTDAPYGTISMANQYNEEITHPLQLSVSTCPVFTLVPDPPEDNLKIFPNPGHGALNIDPGTKANIKIYNEMGELVLDADFEAGFSECELAEPGIYTVLVERADGTSIRRKIIVY